MSKTVYHLQLKGFVGGADFDRMAVDNILDKFGLNVAQLYTRKCRKPVADQLALMKVGGWLSPKEALD